MFPANQIGKLLILVGLGIVIIGVLCLVGSKIPFINRLGHLPGDIRFQSKDGNFVVFAPLVSSILISLIITVIINILVRLFRK
jgi:hypothetical protein